MQYFQAPRSTRGQFMVGWGMSKFGLSGVHLSDSLEADSSLHMGRTRMSMAERALVVFCTWRISAGCTLDVLADRVYVASCGATAALDRKDARKRTDLYEQLQWHKGLEPLPVSIGGHVRKPLQKNAVPVGAAGAPGMRVGRDVEQVGKSASGGPREQPSHLEYDVPLNLLERIELLRVVDEGANTRALPVNQADRGARRRDKDVVESDVIMVECRAYTVRDEKPHDRRNPQKEDRRTSPPGGVYFRRPTPSRRRFPAPAPARAAWSQGFRRAYAFEVGCGGRDDRGKRLWRSGWGGQYMGRREDVGVRVQVRGLGVGGYRIWMRRLNVVRGRLRECAAQFYIRATQKPVQPERDEEQQRGLADAQSCDIMAAGRVLIVSAAELNLWVQGLNERERATAY
ncbi:hypothetical protein C8J57DRAFT_1487074 [Mycena rebaudengoi]|nr:hypothetical protein C8J57DRAFT_1487074 [Mycena rebaudengoi]